MKFSKKRGRPVSKKEEKDYGTKELIQKRKCGITAEILDLLLANNLISQEEHQAGFYYKFLYSLNVGVFHLRASDPGELKGKSTKQHKESWLIKKKEEYEDAAHSLKKQNLFPLLTNVCFFGYRPKCLNRQYYTAKFQNLLTAANNSLSELEDIKLGLGLLAEIFLRTKPEYANFAKTYKA